MMYVIDSDSFGEFVEEITEMHRLRYRVFKQRLNWDVTVSGDLEIDEYDALRPIYLLNRNAAGAVVGCVRLLPTTGPHMLRDSFPALLGPHPAPCDRRVWESSRFSLDVDPTAQKSATGLSPATYELFAAMIEFGLARHLSEIVTVTDARMERILRRAGWPLRRIHQPQRIGDTMALAGYLEISTQALSAIRTMGGIKGPVLWEPVHLKASA